VIRRYLQHYWNSGYVYGMAIGLLMLLFVPGDVALKLAIFAGVTVLTLLGAAFTFWRAGGQVPPTVSKRATLARASAGLPPAQKWTRDDPSVGILTRGPNQGRHVMAGLWPEDGFWYAVDGRIYAKGEGLTYEELRSILMSEGARWLERGEYSDAVLAKYFTL
jgi:hypothetical protein